jgi:[acyl-carrier-protein] S-malonyltransferase
MLGALADAHGEVRETFQEASDRLDYDLWSLAQNGPEELLNTTTHTQPAMLAAGVAVWRVWRAVGGRLPSAMAGHSLGEYSSLVCSGSLRFADAVALVAERGRLMQSAVPEGQGAMAAVLGLDDEAVVALCAEAAQGGVVEAVNFNSPGQVVIAGAADAVERAIERAQQTGAKRALRLAVSVPSHCALMRPAAEALRRRLDEIPLTAPEIPVVHNADVAEHADPEAIREVLARQLFSPVRWVETVRRLRDSGAKAVLELGPGRVLAGLNKRIDKGMKTLCVHDPASLEQGLSLINEGAS